MDLVLNLVSQNILIFALVTLSAVAFIVVYYRCKNRFGYWARKGIRGPPPLPFVGNFLGKFMGNRLRTEVEWVKKYGKVYGTYQGYVPRLNIADPEVLLQICVKDFDVFTNHDENEILADEDDLIARHSKSFIFFLQDKHWKRARALMSPTFTSGKIRRMFRLLDACADDLVECFAQQLPTDRLKQEHRAQVNVSDLYSLFTLDTIATCCFGLKLERSGAANLKTAATRDDFAAQCVKLFDFSVLRILIAVTFPKRILRYFGFKVKPDKDISPMVARTQQLIDQRRAAKSKRFNDYLQLLIDARLDDKMELDELDKAENHHAALTQESLLRDQRQLLEDLEADTSALNNKAALSDLEILSNAMFFIAVGLETTGTLLAHCTYALAFHPEIQERLYEELLKISECNNGDGKKHVRFDYDSLTSCKYLDAVLSESLRVLSPAVQLERVASRDYYLEKYNLRLPKGAKVNLSYYAVQNDPDYWHQPERFDPGRFMPENRDKIVPGSYCPFGLGPRHCLGMRFSLTEAKLALAKIVSNYRFEPAPQCKFPPDSKRSIALNHIKTPFVVIKPRH